jgi:excisionase family DNA binding protein
VTAGDERGSDGASSRPRCTGVSGPEAPDETPGTGGEATESKPEGDSSAGPITRAAFLSVGQFAVVVGLSEKTVLRRIRDGSVRATKIGRLWRIPVTEVRRLLG